jgi:hypothetical protein
LPVSVDSRAKQAGCVRTCRGLLGEDGGAGLGVGGRYRIGFGEAAGARSDGVWACKAALLVSRVTSGEVYHGRIWILGGRYEDCFDRRASVTLAKSE